MSTLQTCARCTMTSGTMAPDVMGIIVHVSADDCIAAVEDDRQLLEQKVRELEGERLLAINEMAKARRRAQDYEGDSMVLRAALLANAEEGGSGLLLRMHTRARKAESQLTAATQRLTVMENALRAPDEILLEKVAQAYIDARIKRSGVPWEPVNNNGLSAMREALLELASELALAAATPNHGPDAGKMVGTASPLDLIAVERRRQIERHGWTPQHDDDEHWSGELGDAAACYAASETMRYNVLEERCGVPPRGWPFINSESWKPSGDGAEQRLRELTKAGALIVAEMERLQRGIAATQGGHGDGE